MLPRVSPEDSATTGDMQEVQRRETVPIPDTLAVS